MAESYQSYQQYQPSAAESVSEPMRPRIDAAAGTTTSVVLSNGDAVTELRGVHQITGAELNPHYGDGTVFATAKSKNSLGVSEISEDTLITIGGVQASCKVFESAGLVHRDSNGTYQEGPGSAREGQQAPEGTPASESFDSVEMTTEVFNGVNQAFEGVSDQNFVSLMASGIAVATGQIDAARLEDQMVSFSGVTKPEAAARVAFVQAAYQSQANAAVTSRCGVDAQDLPAFWEFCKEPAQLGALREAMNKQVHQSSMVGYRALASKFLAHSPPTLAAVIAGGFETRNDGGTPEVYFQGNWMTLAVAARIGLI